MNLDQRWQRFLHLHPRTMLSTDWRTPSKQTEFSLDHLEQDMKSICLLISRWSILFELLYHSFLLYPFSYTFFCVKTMLQTWQRGPQRNESGTGMPALWRSFQFLNSNLSSVPFQGLKMSLNISSLCVYNQESTSILEEYVSLLIPTVKSTPL